MSHPSSQQISAARTEEDALRKQIVKALEDIYDPEIPVNICALGLIYDISIYPIHNIHISMTLTSPNCPVAESLPEEVRTAVSALPDVNEVEIALVFEPPYHMDMMTEEAKLTLGFI